MPLIVVTDDNFGTTALSILVTVLGDRRPHLACCVVSSLMLAQTSDSLSIRSLEAKLLLLNPGQDTDQDQD